MSSMTRKDELLAAYDDACSYSWESLESVLNGIGDEEAAFRHPIYSDTETEEHHPPSGTILWHLVHLADCYGWYKAVIEARPVRPEDTVGPEAYTLREAKENLLTWRAALRETIVNVPDDQLDEPIHSGKTVASLTRMSIRHDAWHASQIAVARRLYRHR